MKRPCPRCEGEKTVKCAACKRPGIKCPRCGGKGLVRILLGNERVLTALWENFERFARQTASEIYLELLESGVYSKKSVRRDALMSIGKYMGKIAEWKKQGEKWKLQSR